MMTRFKEQRGSVLIAVMWLLAMLSVFSWAVARQVTQELSFGQWLRDRVVGRSLARAAVQRTLLELQSDKFKTFDALNEKWASNPEAFRNIKLGDGMFTVSCKQNEIELFGACDESARISLNESDELLLTTLFLAAETGVRKEEAKEIAQAIIDWRDADSNPLAEGAESSYYEGLSKPYSAPNRPFQSVEELSMVRGITPEIFAKVKPFITVYSGGRVNFNTASQTALKALGLSDMLARKVMDFRRGADGEIGTSDDEVFQDVSQITPVLSVGMNFSGEEYEQIANATSKGWVSVVSHVFRVEAKGVLNRESRKTDTYITCVINRDGSILYWKEGGEAP